MHMRIKTPGIPPPYLDFSPFKNIIGT